jgi:hypothetical protein
MRTKRRRLQRDDDKERSKQVNIQVQVQVQVQAYHSTLNYAQVIKMWRAESILNGIRPFELSQNRLTDFQTYRITELHV